MTQVIQNLQTVLERAVVKILNKEIFKGTAFFISPRHLLTAYHCVQFIDENALFVKNTAYGRLRVLLDSEKSCPSPEIDIAVLTLAPEVMVKITDYLPLGLITENHATDDILAVGYPAEILSFLEGQIHGFPEKYPRQFFNNVMKATGQSGGPVYHLATQRVVGLALSVYQPEVLREGGLAGRFDILFQQWPELSALNQSAIAQWKRRLGRESLLSKSSPHQLVKRGFAKIFALVKLGLFISAGIIVTVWLFNELKDRGLINMPTIPHGVERNPEKAKNSFNESQGYDKAIAKIDQQSTKDEIPKNRQPSEIDKIIPSSVADVLHTIVVADTNNWQGGLSFSKDLNRIKDLAETISNHTGLELKLHEISGNNVNRNNVTKILENLSIGSGDVIFFHYAGHGGHTSGKSTLWPFMDIQGGTIDVAWVESTLEQKNSRFLVILAGTCNNFDDSLNPVWSRAIRGTPSSEGYRQLFLNYRGHVFASGSKPGQYSWGNAEYGCFFTDAFLKNLNTELASANPNWYAIMKRTEAPIDIEGKKQIPQSQVEISSIRN